MSAFIEKIKICNFLSFLGEYEVNLKPFSAIICNFYEGKDDLLRAFEFVLGARLADLRIENPLDLVHKVLREEFLVNRDVHCYVEITLGQVQEKKQLKFSRSIKNGANNPRIEHKISNLVTSSLLYEEKLNFLGIYTRQKNLIFYKSYFNNVIWGTAEDLEMTICTCLRENYLFEEWKNANKEMKHLNKLKSHAAEKHYTSMKTSHSVIAKFTKKYESFLKSRESTVGKFLQDFTTDSSSESTPSVTDSSEESLISDEFEKNEKNILKLEKEIQVLTKKIHELELEEAFLTSYLHHEEITSASKPVNASVLQNRISHIKAKIQEKENLISKIWQEIQIVTVDIDTINHKIPFVLIALQEIQTKNNRQNRFTQYGKFYDYLQPSRYVHLLKHIIGVEIFYAHLCDSIEEAFLLLNQLKDMKYEHREVFLPFEHYSHKLKDIIIASGERGVQINTLEELLIFLCKLKHYKLIDEVPVIVQKDFDFGNAAPEEYTIYLRNNIYFTNEGLICCKTDENDFYLETEKELRKNLTQLYIEEEMNFRKWDDLLFMKWETLTQLNSLENDVLYLKQKWKKSTQKSQIVRELSPISQIYEEFHEIFKEHAELTEKCESELQEEEEPFFAEKSSSASFNEESVNLIVKNLEDVVEEKIKIQTNLKELTLELRQLHIVPVHDFRQPKNYLKFQNNYFVDKTKLYFEKEFKKLKNLIREDDLEDFLGSEEWRKTFISSLINDYNEIKTKLKTASEEFLEISTARKTKLYQLFDHCSRYLSNTFSNILNDALPFIKINFGFGEEKIHIMSCLGKEKINIVDIKHFNSLFKFISAFALFLEISVFEKIPLMIIEDVEEFFPIHSDNLEAIMELSDLKKILPDNENPRFSLLMRLGQFLKHFIKKNSPGRLIRNNGSNTGYVNGPMQILFFVKEDLVHAADHCIWIQNQILPEEYITEDCNSYSEIHEINFENLNK